MTLSPFLSPFHCPHALILASLLQGPELGGEGGSVLAGQQVHKLGHGEVQVVLEGREEGV